MDTEAFVNLCEQYMHLLEKTGYKPVRDDNPGNRACWCANEARCMILDDREKAMRWLGFVQGILFAISLATVDELRDSTRKVLTTP